MLLLLTGLVAVLVILLGHFTWPWTDDFANIGHIRSYSGVSQFVWQWYRGWDGRIVTYVLLAVMMRNVECLNEIVMFHALCFVLTAFLIANLWRKLCFSDTAKVEVYDVLVMISCLWLGYRPIISETLYWASGGMNYTLIPFFSILWLNLMYYVLFREFRIRFGKVILPVLLLFSLFVGTGNQTSPLVLVLLTVLMIRFSGRNIWRNKIALSILCSFIIGAVIMYIAPGNYIRATHGPGSFHFSLPGLIRNYAQIAVLFASTGKWLLLCSVIGAAGSVAFSYKGKFRGRFHRSEDLDEIKKGGSRVWALAFLGAVILCLVPFTLVPDFASPRASVFFQLFLVLCVWCSAAFFVPLLLNKAPKKIHDLVNISKYVVPVLLSAVVIVLASRDIIDGRNIYLQMMKRHKYLSTVARAYKGKRLILKVKPVSGKVPITLSYVELQPYINNRFNSLVASYYGIDGYIRLDK